LEDSDDEQQLIHNMTDIKAPVRFSNQSQSSKGNNQRQVDDRMSGTSQQPHLTDVEYFKQKIESE